MTHDAIPAYGLWGLVLLWRLFGLYRRAFHRDVWLPAHHLSAFRMAYADLSGSRSVLARCRPSVVDPVWPDRRPALECPPHTEHCRGLRWLHPAVGRLEGPLCG